MSTWSMSQQDLDAYNRDGFVIVRGLFSGDEVQALRTRFDRIANEPEVVPGFFEPDVYSTDPLKRYPRVMHPHRWNELARRMMLHTGVKTAIEAILNEPAVACQAMYYFKPPGSPGQALHQDNFYLAVKPGTCVAAWTAIDPATPDNGGMYLVPGSHQMDIFCPDPDDLKRTVRSNLVDVPAGMKAVPAEMEPGDTLFFNGSVIHGSGRNRSKDTWRRSLIGHYMARSSTHINAAYFPIYDFDGNEIQYDAAAAGGPCGYAIAGLAANSYGVDAQLH